MPPLVTNFSHLEQHDAQLVRLGMLTAATNAASAVVLDEADTRKIIDEQLRAAGWTVDSVTISFGKGARPEPSLRFDHRSDPVGGD